MLTLWAYLRYVRQPSWRRYLVVVLAFILGLMSKPMLVTLPFVLLLLDYWPLRRFELSTLNFQPSTILRLIREKIPLLALSAVFCGITMFTQEEARSSNMPPLLCLMNTAVSYFIYLEQLFWPANLAVHYPYPKHGLPPGEVITAVLVLTAISVAAWIARRKYPCLLVGWLWYVGMLVPVIGLVQVGAQAHADRYTYLPQIGLCLALTWLLAGVSTGWRNGRIVLGVLGAGILTALIFRAHAQTAYWQNSETVWFHALDCTADNDVAHNNVGEIFQQRGRLDEAISHFKKAVEIARNNAEAENNLGYWLFQTGQTNGAVAYLQQALAIRPGFAEARNNLGVILLQSGQVDEAIVELQKTVALQPDFAEAHNNLGNACFQNQQLDEAVVQYQAAIAIQPDYAEAHCNLSFALLQKRQVDAAIMQAQAALKLRPDYAKAHKNLGIALVQKGQLDEGIAHLQRALAIQPDFAEAQSDLTHIAWIMATAPDATFRNGTKAVELAQQTDQLAGGKNPVMAATLAAALAEAGRFPEAIANAQRALQLASSQTNAALAATLERQLKLYKAGSPFHEPRKAP
jgi:tetratricopeptide (TPR) repeat protein